MRVYELYVNTNTSTTSKKKENNILGRHLPESHGSAKALEIDQNDNIIIF